MNNKYKHNLLTVLLVLIMFALACSELTETAPTKTPNYDSTIMSEVETFIALTSEAKALVLLPTDVITVLGTPDPRTATVDALLTQSALAQTQAAEQINTQIPSETKEVVPATIPPITAGFNCVPVSTQRDLAQVVRVIDGDTIEVIVNGTTQRVRYIGMDTPEVGTPYYQEATDANAVLVAGQTLTLVKDVSETDQYGRLLRYVFVGDDLFVNYQLVKDGYAQILTYPPDVACSDFFLETQRDAKNANLGIWGFVIAPTNTTAPVATSPPAAECSCSANIYNCADFSTHSAAQACFEYCISQGRGDIHRLDGDNDGSACESLP